MNEQDQIKAIAEMDGQLRDSHWSALSLRPDSWYECSVCGKQVAFQENSGVVCGYPNIKLPDYLRSRDAIVPVIEKQPPNIQHGVAQHLTIMRGWTFLCTSQQLCEALLRATGKWKE